MKGQFRPVVEKASHPTPISGQEERLVCLLSVGMHLDLCYSGY